MAYDINLINLNNSAFSEPSGLEGSHRYMLFSTWTCFTGDPPSQSFTTGGGAANGVQDIGLSDNTLTVLLNDGRLLTATFTFPSITGTLSNVLVSIDSISQIIQVYVNDVAATSTSVTWGAPATINPNILWEVATFGFPSRPGIGDHYIATPGSFVNLSSVPNRRWFIDGSGDAVDPLTSGAPSPVVFLTVPPGDNNPGDFFKNFGTGPGPWTFTGTSIVLDTTCKQPPPTSFIFEAADLWFSPTPTFVDLTNAANVGQFIDSNGCAIYLGTQGRLPFGYVPPVYLTVPSGSPADSWATNFGNGGTFTLQNGDLSFGIFGPCCGPPFPPIPPTPGPPGPLGYACDQALDALTNVRTLQALDPPRVIVANPVVRYLQARGLGKGPGSL